MPKHLTTNGSKKPSKLKQDLSASNGPGKSEALVAEFRHLLNRRFVERFEASSNAGSPSRPAAIPTRKISTEISALLTQREREVCRCVVSGMTTNDIASRLAISPRTVEIHRSRIMRKTGARNVATLVHTAISAA